MPHRSPAEVRQLTSSYSREARSVLYQAYRHNPTFAYLFDRQRPGFDQRVRATVRELVNRHFAEDQPALGIVIDERLVGVVLIAQPQRRLEITESWSWRLRMVLTAGLRGTQRYLDYHEKLLALVPFGAFHQLPLLGVHPEFQGKHLGMQLLSALHQWCDEDPHSQGVILNTGNPHYLQYYRKLGYETLGSVSIGPIDEHVLLHPRPQAFG